MQEVQSYNGQQHHAVQIKPESLQQHNSSVGQNMYQSTRPSNLGPDASLDNSLMQVIPQSNIDNILFDEHDIGNSR